MRILVVEDDENSRVLQHTILEGNGYEVVSARNGREALDRLKEAIPDLIISDIMMPDMDGYALCRTLKSDPALAGIPFVIYSATFTTEADQQLARELGADLFLIKPMAQDEFMEQIRGVLAKPPAPSPVRTLSPPEREKLDAQYISTIARKLDKKILELNDARARLRSSEERSHLFLNAIADMAFIKDEAFRLWYVNDAYAAFHGRPAEAILGRTDYELAPREAADRWRASDQRVLETGRPATDHDEIRGRMYETRKFPVPLEGGKTGIGGLVRDVTEQKRMEAAVRDQLDELRRWHDGTMGREMRVIELKNEVNELLARLGEPPRYGVVDSEV
ncbi:MAG: response regulator [Kiritimatiellae bacterium]|nr:response regulator [Kiritimatiellia bacterium]